MSIVNEGLLDLLSELCLFASVAKGSISPPPSVSGHGTSKLFHSSNCLHS